MPISYQKNPLQSWNLVTDKQLLWYLVAVNTVMNFNKVNFCVQLQNSFKKFAFSIPYVK